MLAHEFDVSFWYAAKRHVVETLAVISQQDTESGPAQVYRFVEHRIEDRHEVAGIGIDYLQHLGGCRLLLQRLPLLSDQPCVFDRDYRLIGEGADKFDLPVGKRLDPPPRKNDG